MYACMHACTYTSQKVNTYVYMYIWEFPKIRGILGPYNKDPIILGTILRSPISGNSHILSYITVHYNKEYTVVCLHLINL